MHAALVVNEINQQLQPKNIQHVNFQQIFFWAFCQKFHTKLAFLNGSVVQRFESDTSISCLPLIISVLAIHQWSCQSNIDRRTRATCVSCSYFRALCWWPDLCHQKNTLILSYYCEIIYYRCPIITATYCACPACSCSPRRLTCAALQSPCRHLSPSFCPLHRFVSWRDVLSYRILCI